MMTKEEVAETTKRVRPTLWAFAYVITRDFRMSEVVLQEVEEELAKRKDALGGGDIIFLRDALEIVRTFAVKEYEATTSSKVALSPEALDRVGKQLGELGTPDVIEKRSKMILKRLAELPKTDQKIAIQRFVGLRTYGALSKKTGRPVEELRLKLGSLRQALIPSSGGRKTMRMRASK